MTKQRLQKELPKFQKRINNFCDTLVEESKENYNNPAMPFKQYAEKLKLDINKSFQEFFLTSKGGQAALKEFLQKEEKENPHIPKELRWAAWQKKSQQMYTQATKKKFEFSEKTLEKPFHEQLGIPWAFLDRVYSAAVKFLEAGKYQEAGGVFDLLLFFHPMVLEYWSGKAAALFGLQEYEKALYQYACSLYLSPENPAIFFEMSRCYFHLKDSEHCLSSLDVCLDLCGNDKTHADLKTKANDVKQAIISKKLKI